MRFSVYRYNPDVDAEPRMQDYDITLEPTDRMLLDALVRIIENKNGGANNQIFNIGHPGNEASIAELADMMLDIMREFKGFETIRSQVKITVANGQEYYGAGYQDIDTRVPKINKAANLLGWKPTTNMRDAVRKTISYYYADTEKLLATA